MLLATLYTLCLVMVSHLIGAGPASLGADTTASTSTTVATTAAASVAPEAAPDRTGAVARPIRITVLYDNRSLQPTLQSDWGFACLVSGPEKTVLFDTGSNPDILLSNMRALSIDPQHVDAVVLSHAHQDHTGGLFAILARKSDIGVYCPASFSEGFTDRVREVGATLIPVRAASTICPGLTVTAPMGSSPEEIGLVIDSAEGPVLLTGCAHPGVATMAQTAATLGHGSLYAVLGGFHLSSRSAAEVSAIIEDLKRLGVRRCGPAHCTGEAATAQMSRAFGNGFIAMGVGAVVEF